MPTKVFFNLNEEKQKKIINASILEFSNYALEEVQVKRIVEEAKIPRGSFYQYFEDIEDLFCYVLISIRKTMFNEEIIKNNINTQTEFIDFIGDYAKNRITSHMENINRVDINIINQVKKSDKAISLIIDTFKFMPTLDNYSNFELLGEIAFPTITITLKKYLKNIITGKEAIKEIETKLNLIKNGVNNL